MDTKSITIAKFVKLLNIEDSKIKFLTEIYITWGIKKPKIARLRSIEGTGGNLWGTVTRKDTDQIEIEWIYNWRFLTNYDTIRAIFNMDLEVE